MGGRFFALANSTKMCYTYDDLSRVTSRTIKNLADDTVISTETFTYDLAGNITDAPDNCFAYDTNNRLVVFNGENVMYDADGNMTAGNNTCFGYDSLNRLIYAGDHDYTYNAENVRIRNLCTDDDTTYVYNINCKLSQLLVKTTNGVTTKYVYGRGLIGEETNNVFKTYHFDSRGSTIAITDMSGTITDTFAYDTYGKCVAHTGTSDVIFGYNGRDGVVTDKNGLIYMRARYYSPEMRRFVNADIIAGEITNAITLNRYAYANGNPVSFVDPLGLWSLKGAWNSFTNWVEEKIVEPVSTFVEEKIVEPIKEYVVEPVQEFFEDVGETVETIAGEINKNLIQPIGEAVTAVGDWLEDAGDWLNENARNKDGSYSLYDNDRFRDRDSFHEQIFAFTPSGSGLDFDASDGNVGIGGKLEADVITGGWEGKKANLSLLDFGHAEASAEISSANGVSFGALASIWSPSFSFSIGNVSIEIGAEVGAIGAGRTKIENGVSFYGAYGIGGSVSVSFAN